MKSFAFSILLLACLASSSIGDDLQKLDPVLKSFIVRDQKSPMAPKRVLRKDDLLCFGFCSWAIASNGVAQEMLNVIMKVSGSPESLKALGVNVRSVIGDIVTADVPVRTLSDLIRLPNVAYIQAARQMLINRNMQPTLDVSVPETKADQVWTSAQGYTGKGVIIGVIDTGIDWDNPDFRNEDGTSRILYIWDQTMDATGKHPPIYNYGTEWSKAEIDAGLCQEMDIEGHGTHVTSTAAGNGNNGKEFVGMAPEADIIAVKTNFEDSYTIDAAAYIFRRASEMNKAAVINMSFGSLWGPRDGTDFIDIALDRLLDKNGCSIVAAAGNDGGSNVHVGVSSLRQPVGSNYPYMAIQPLVGARYVPIEIWYNWADLISVRLLLPKDKNGNLSDFGIGWVSKGETRVIDIQDGPLTGAEVMIDTSQISLDLRPGLNGIYIHIYDNDDATIPVDDYTYAIELSGPGAGFDAYLPYYAIFTNKVNSLVFPDKSFLLEGDGDKTILSPASASRIICVSSYITKNEWIDSEYRVRSEDNLRIDSISAFSSRGPLMDGSRKPDIAAPGEFIVASFSSDSWEKPRNIYRDGNHILWRGTSMSSPHVAGAIALMLQQNPQLSADEIRNMLFNSAIDRGPAGWDKAWGYGKLDILTAMNIPPVPDGLQAEPLDGAVGLKWLTGENITGYKIYYSVKGKSSVVDVGKTASYRLSDLANGTPISLSISAYNAAGNESPKTREIIITPNPSETDITPPKVPEGLSFIPVDKALILSWSGSNDYDLAGYKVYYGRSSQNYSSTVNAGNKVSYIIESLTNGSGIYVAVTAYDRSGNESAKSEEAYSVPRLSLKPEVRYQSGFPVSLFQDIYSSPAVYDVDADGRMEIAIIARDGKVALLQSNGKYMPGWPIFTGTPTVSSPAICDINGDNRAEIIVGSGRYLYVWDYHGKVIKDWHRKLDDNIIGSPVIADLNGDGRAEIGIAQGNGKVQFFRGDNSVLVSISVNSEIYSSVAVGDINGDYQKEIVIGSKENVHVFRPDGSILMELPAEEIYSSASIGDLDGDGLPEIVAASINGTVYAWHCDGSPVTGWQIKLQGEIYSSPVIGDIDGDKISLETVICTREGLIYVFRSDGTIMDGWPVTVMDTITGSPALGDIDGDGKTDIVIGTSTGLRYLGLVYAFNSDGKRKDRFPLYTDGNITDSSPSLSDIDGDGDIELIIGSCRYWDETGGQLHIWDLGGSPKSNWSGFRHDPCHTGTADDIIKPYFTISILQNAALPKYIDIYVVASEPLSKTPILAVESNGVIKDIPLIPFATPGIYNADYIASISGTYFFTVSGRDVNGNTGSSSKSVFIRTDEDIQSLVSKTSLFNNYPNPFNPGTWIPYTLAKAEDVIIDIYNSSGRKIRSLSIGSKTPGNYISRQDAAYWDGKDENAQAVSSGVYFYILKAGDFRAVKKMTLQK